MNLRMMVTSGMVSLLAAMVLAFVTLSGDLFTSWVDNLRHPGFWVFYLRSVGWLFIAGLASTMVTLLLLPDQKGEVQRIDE